MRPPKRKPFTATARSLAVASGALVLGFTTFFGAFDAPDRQGANVADLATVVSPREAQASVASLRITYAARISGHRIGTGVLSANLDGDRYTATLNARTTAVGRLVSPGQGEAVSRGIFGNAVPVPVSYDLSASEDEFTNTVRMRLRRGDIAELSAEPPLSEHPHRVAVRAQHRRDVVDPLSALLMPVPNVESAAGPAACDRTIPLFDGRQRFDVAFSFVRMEQVQFGNGQAAVCRMRYRPIAGHRSNRRANQELAANNDIYVWLTQVGDEALVAPVRMEVGLEFGKLSVQAIEFAAR